MNFSDINKKSAITRKPCKKLSDLDIGPVHKIEKIVRLNTKFGKCILVETVDLCVFLPTRFEKVLTDEDIEEMNKNQCGFKITNSVDVGKVNPAINIEFLNI